MNNDLNEQKDVVNSETNNNLVGINPNENINKTDDVEKLVEVKNRATIPLIIILVLIVSLVSVFGYWLYTKDDSLKPKEVFINAFDQVETFVDNKLSSAFNSSNDVIKTSHKITSEVSSSNVELALLTTLLKKLELDLLVELDFNSKIINSNLDVKYNNKDAVNLKAILNNKTAYLGLGNLYDKYIKQDFDTEWNIETENIENINKAFKNIIKIAKDSLKDEYFSSEKVKLNNEKMTKYILSIPKFKDYAKDVVNGIKSNNELMQELKNITNLKEEELIEKIDSYVSTISEDRTFNVIVYLDKNNKLKKITSKDEEVIIENVDGRYNVLFKDESGSLIKMADVKYEKDYFEFNFNYEGVVLEGIIDKKNNANNITLNLKVVCSKDNEFCTEGEISITNKGAKNKADLVINIKIPNEGIDSLIIKDSYEIILGSPINLPDLSNAINYTLLNDTETEKIMSNVINNEALKEIITDLNLQDYFEDESIEDIFINACTKANSGEYVETKDNYYIECRNSACKITDTTTNTILKASKCDSINSL